MLSSKHWSCWYSQHLVRPRVIPEYLVLRGCLRAFALERAVQQIRSLFELEGTCGRYTTRAKLCHLRSLLNIQVERILEQLHVAFKLSLL